MSVYLSICYTSNHLGGAYYDEQEEVIYILNDIAEDQEFTSLSNCKVDHFIYFLNQHVSSGK